MIIVASQRGGAMQLGAHLLKTENEHVTVHDIRGFVAEDVPGAMKEAQAMSAGTRAKQPLFSVSLNPPAQENVRVEVFEDALRRIEERMGLFGQPRVVIFHEKEGRRHCHSVWSRIDAETMTAKPLPFYKNRMQEISRELYLEHSWKMPRGLMNSKEHDPRNFDLAEWQQAKRIGRDPRQLREIMQDCWAVSDSRAAFARALEERGLYLARGDRRGHVAVSYEGEVFSVARMTERKSKEVRQRLGNEQELRSVDETRAHIATIIEPRLRHLLARERLEHQQQSEPLERQRGAMRDAHDAERRRLEQGLRQREDSERAARNERMRHGLFGLLDRLTGAQERHRKQNEMEAYFGLMRDREQRQALIAAQLQERQALQIRIEAERQSHAERILELHRDLARQREQQMHLERLTQQFQRQVQHQPQQPDAMPAPVSAQAKLERLQPANPQQQLVQLNQQRTPEIQKPQPAVAAQQSPPNAPEPPQPPAPGPEPSR